jgi:hypothetical protein
LSKWIATQRRWQKRGTLRPEREQLMRAAGFDFSPRSGPYPREFPASLVEETVARYRAGATLHQLARDSPAGVETIRGWIVAAGVPIRVGGRRLPVSDALLAELAAKGLSRREIGNEVGMSKVAVTKRFSRMAQRG